MDNGRYNLTEEDLEALNVAKAELNKSIELLKGLGLRKTNIEIELVNHIKKTLAE